MSLLVTLSVVAASAASLAKLASESALGASPPVLPTGEQHQQQRTKRRGSRSQSIDSMPRFSWDTLPVFFHSANSSGPWSEAAVAAIAKFPMATFEKDHAYAGGHAGATEETLNPSACRRVATASNGTTSTVYYLNSAIDWPFYALHQQMLDHPEYRVVDQNGDEVLIVGQYGFNHSIQAVHDMWLQDCSNAIDNGCSGCFVDRSNNLTQLNASKHLSPAQANQYAESHMGLIADLNNLLASKPHGGAFAVNNNEARAGANQTFVMLEDFAASEHCIQVLQDVVGRGLGVQAHAGDLPDGSGVEVNPCTNGDTNAMAAFLIGAGKYSYYHCAATWASESSWPAVADPWLDWLPEYDRPLGEPLSDGAKSMDGTWWRKFSSGTTVAFDSVLNNGTIFWASGEVSIGPVAVPRHVRVGAGAVKGGCAWVTL